MSKSNKYQKYTKRIWKVYQTNTKSIPRDIKSIPKITTFNTKQMLKEFKRNTKIIPKESKTLPNNCTIH